eukprot:1700810-Rhodomonas_salina.2
MSNNLKYLAKAISAHKQYLNPKKLFKRSSSEPAETMKADIENYEAKPAWKVLGARKLAREAMSNNYESPSVVETQSAVLSNRLAWRVLAHRRHHRLAISDTANGLSEDLGCMKTLRKISIEHDVAPYLAEVERTCADVEDANMSLNKLVLAA